MDIKLESQVGDASKQGGARGWRAADYMVLHLTRCGFDVARALGSAVIRNLSRVLERFIAEQLQRIVREQLAFPNHVGLPKRALSTT